MTTVDDLNAKLERVALDLHALQRCVAHIDKRTSATRVWDMLMKAAVVILVPAAGALIAHEVRIGTIEGNRFTARDGQALERALESQMQSWLVETETRLTEAIGKLPPEWLRELVTELKAGQSDIRDRLTRLETKFDVVNGNGDK